MPCPRPCEGVRDQAVVLRPTRRDVADVVLQEVGYKVPLTNEADIASQIAKVLAELAANPDLLNRLRQQGMAYARERLTWEAKAESTTRVLNWAVGRGPKPDLLPPSMLRTQAT